MGLESLAITNLMNKNIIVAEQDLNLITISKIMSNNDIGSVVIVDDINTRRPIGIITERDIVKTIGMIQPQQLLVPIRDYMSRPLITLSSKASVYDAIKLMYEKKIRRILILEKEKLVGIITDKDIFRSLVNNKELLSTTVGAHLPIPEDKLKNEISQFWFNNTFIE
ncbi:MAG: cyclic nucleotide-binding/CBS domain-containing protein [Candidatus Nitrosocosmicus sp.]|nr:CBS domain-containing protein [Candidatus Nitrosocosmicus sp. SS]KAF0867609.1 CBS domain-containing protein [Candidatus Nitrosocosmicus sp. SS]MDR4492441.1 CBS domain-containing protein [Candidatus Nitrosocosmicus sp.]HET6589639.1 CBS domain-containing protein [Candidatus Nitrosocosmicus sp.]